MTSSEAPLVAVAVDKDKNSQSAFKWALDNVVVKGQSILIIHVNTKAGHVDDEAMKEMFTPFRCFSTRKNIQCKDVVVDGTDVLRALVDYVSRTTIAKLVIGASSKGGLLRTLRNATDLSTNIATNMPDFCTVYVINKGKPYYVRNATRPPLVLSRAPMIRPEVAESLHVQNNRVEVGYNNKAQQKETETMRSPFTRPGRAYTGTSFSEMGHTDISFISNDKSHFEGHAYRPSNMSESFDNSFDSSPSPNRSFVGSSFISTSSDSSSSYSAVQDDMEAEMKRLRLELKQTMDMYSTACKEALTAKQSAAELHRLKKEEERRIEEFRLAEEAALALAEVEKAKYKAALETAEAAKRMAELEAQKRKIAEMKALQHAQERQRANDSRQQSDLKCRKYTIEEIEAATEFFCPSRKIGKGGYGPVFKCNLDHTPVAIKVLKPDAAQGRSQFQQEVDILSCIRHPNMVLLLGACPEYGCLVYEYMSNGSLEDRLFQYGNTPPIPWQHRFRIVAEIATALLFLHQTKPEPLVHRDLKPANILLDRNYVSKISDVGLARLVPPNVAENVTQYLMTSTAGTFCYIDPEYQQTGMLGTKSDIYSFGIILLQIITGKPPMGLTHQVEYAIEKGTFTSILDQDVLDWPVNEALAVAELGLKCAQLRRKDRPDLGTVILPELNRLRTLADESLDQLVLPKACFNSNPHSQVSSHVSSQEMSSSSQVHSGYESRSRYSERSPVRKRIEHS